MPVFDLDEDTFAVVVPRVAYVERESRIPGRWARSATDVTNGKLASDHFDDIVQRMVGVMAYKLSQHVSAIDSAKKSTCFENFSVPKLSVWKMDCLLGTIIPAHSHPELSHPGATHEVRE